MPPEDGVSVIPVSLPGEKKMADLSDDCLERLLDEQLGAADMLMIEGVANIQAAADVVKLSGARKFNQEDPLEAAASEKILNG
jgi:hypothetical protein